MPNLRTLALFGLRFLVIFTLLVLPWKSFREFAGGVFQLESQLLLSVCLPQKLVDVEAYRDPQHRSIDTKILLSDPRNARPDGTVAAKVLTLDLFSLAWIPHAVWFALCGATPVTWPRRIKMVLAGIIVTQLLVGTTIFSTALTVVLPESAPAWQSWVLAALNHLVLDNLWFSFVPPLLLWVVWLASQGDWQEALQPKAAHPKPEVKTARQTDGGVHGSSARLNGSRG